MLVLPLAVTDPGDLVRVETLFAAMWSVKRAVQRDARARVDAYWAAKHERDGDGGKAARARLGLSREGLERCGYRHLERSGHLKHHVSKALVMHMADQVWAGVDRHMFPDATGRRFGRPKAGTWWDFTRIPGRARSHTKVNKWETFRLVGTLQGHLDAYTRGVSLMQPRRMPVPALPDGSTVATGKILACGEPQMRKATWWDHDGPFAVVFAGGPTGTRGDLVLPVRLPQGPGRRARLEHFLADPGQWHKVDLVRRRKASAPGGWVYEAHLMILGPGDASPAVRVMRDRAARLGRVGGVDGNVSNLSIVSLPATVDPADGQPTSTRIELSDQERARLEKQARKSKGRARALERSRRATNARQYGLSKKQAERAARRAEHGLEPKQVTVLGGARAARADGVPKQAYRRDELSGGYHRVRSRIAEAAASAAEHKRHRARALARNIIAVHGPVLTIEDCDLRTWYRLWGRRLAQTTPGMLISALATECGSAGGRLLRASTWTTALSQHCLCGARVTKTLRDRQHRCAACGLTGDRDLTSAALAAFVTLTDPDDPTTAYLDTTASRHARIVYGQGLEEALRESTTPSPKPHLGPSRVAAPPASRTRSYRGGASARRIADQRTRTTPDETRHQRDHAGKLGHRTGRNPPNPPG
ncbi:zinc ribbon domain-containing protein [Actinomadura rudentiformis]|uniref:Transposase n=1 Tax=Actinomadura rudentiformis TaxID=359158 RepID=A0A6H9YI42_9ACTN|nr:transposase [Actinomadura rudentiformis]KAB2342116.1 transposase [Actinomadura rudentiformis]